MRFPVFLTFLIVVASPAVAKECRMPDVPAGAHVQLPPECKATVRTRSTGVTTQDVLKADQGFIDLGNGTKVRVGGRIRAEVGVRP